MIESIEEEYRPVLLTSTTGRSSDPVPFVYTKHDLHRLELAGKRTMEVGESTREYRHVNVFPFAPHLAFWFTHYAGLGFGAMMVGSGGGKTMGTQGNLTLIDRVNPDILIGMPTFLYHLCGQAVESGKKWTNLKLLVFGGEKTSQGLRARMVDLCEKLGSPNIRIMGTYGLTEAKMAFPQCPTSLDQGSSGYHLFPDMAIFEIIDPITGKVMGENEPGEIVITPLDARGTVVLRYRTGDIAEGGMSWERCPHCGRIGPKIMGPISRSSEIRSLNLDKVKGTLVDFNFLEHVLDNEKGIAAWQLEISKRHDDPHQVDELHLHLCLEPGMSQQDVEGRITERIYDQAEIRPNAVHFLNLIEMRDRLGVGKLLKEVKILDRRVKTPVATQRSTPTQTIQV